MWKLFEPRSTPATFTEVRGGGMCAGLAGRLRARTRDCMRVRGVGTIDPMTIAYWCIVAAAVLPYLFQIYAKFSGPGFNNYRPRDFLDRLEGARKRAHWA